MIEVVNMAVPIHVDERSFSEVLMDILDDGYRISFEKLPGHDVIRVVVQDSKDLSSTAHLIDEKELRKACFQDVRIMNHLTEMQKNLDEYRKNREIKK